MKNRINLLDGKNVWETKEIDELPSITLSDGPHGLRKQAVGGDNLGITGSIPATCYPTASLVASSFDRKLVERLAHHLAIEAHSQRVNIVLGPGINIKRTPICGRNFEYFSEDPFLTGELAATYIKTMEAMKVGTSVKHFFANNHENGRFYMDSIVDDRALHEIYLKAFKRAVQEEPATVMSSYNKINGIYGTEHPLIEEELRNKWGFKGVVISDWGAIDNRIKSLKAGTDLEMPSTYGNSFELIEKEYQNDIELENAISKSYERIVQMIKRYKNLPKASFSIDEHHEIARQIARESMVLLKNEQQILPLTKKDQILIVGGFIDEIRFQGGGSSNVNPTKVDQFSEIAGKYSDNIVLTKGYHVNQDKIDHKLLEEAKDLAKKADKIVYLMGLPNAYEIEGFDREHLDFPEIQLTVLKELLKENKNIVVVTMAGSVVNLSFVDEVKGLLLAYLGGQAAASAIMDNLYALHNPSGRLSETFIDDLSSCIVDHQKNNNAYYYHESIYVGYRYYNTFNINVRFPFGYGLSYTEFKYHSLEIKQDNDQYKVVIELENIGNHKGSEVIQIYQSYLGKGVYRAKKTLCGFDKVTLEKGEKKTVVINLSLEEFKLYDPKSKAFYLESGTYQVSVSKNVNEDVLTAKIDLAGREPKPSNLSYQKAVFDASDFHVLFASKLPQQSVKRKRPFTMTSTLSDLRTTFTGKIVSLFVLREAKKILKDAKDSWQYEVMKKTILDSPIRSLVSFGGENFTAQMGEGIVDFANLKVLRGLKKIIKKS